MPDDRADPDVPPTSPAPVLLRLPGRVVASALVLHGEPLVDDPDLVISRGADRLGPRARAALGAHIGDLRTIAVPDLSTAPVPPTELLALFGAADEQLARVAAAGSATAVALARPVSEAVSASAAVIAGATLLAGPRDVVVDTAVPRVWSAGPSRDPSTADWLVLDRTRSADGSPSGTRTHGLSRFGLPELVAHVADPGDLAAWDAAILGAAQRLLDQLGDVPGPDLMLPGHLPVGLADVATAYGESVEPDDPGLARRCLLRLHADAGDDDHGDDDHGELHLSGDPSADLFSG